MVLVSSLAQMWRHKTEPIKVVKNYSKTLSSGNGRVIFTVTPGRYVLKISGK